MSSRHTWSPQNGWSRRDFLKAAGGLVAAAGIGPAFHVFTQPSQKLSGDLKILQWSHFVPQHDKWFDPFAKAWGDSNGVNVTVDHINLADIPSRAAAEINAKEGHDLIEFLYPPSALEPSVLDLTDINQEAVKRFGKQIDLATRSTYNATTKKYYGFCHGWVPDPADYRKSMWDKAGMPNGPTTWQELLDGGKAIKDQQGVQLGIGMSNELDSNMACRAIMWSFGASEQDKDENITINSPETVAAVEYMKKLYDATMTQEIFSWNVASNNQALIAGTASYILNSISAYRTAQGANPDIADDIFFGAALKGPSGAGWVSEHVIPIYIIPTYAKNPDAAKEFILNLVANYNQVVYNSQLYNFPSFATTAPQLMGKDGWLEKDPFGSKPADKLKVLETTESWSTVIGHPGPANAAIGEIFGTFLIPQMFAKAARGEMSAKDAVADAEKQIIPIYEKWRKQGLVGGTK